MPKSATPAHWSSKEHRKSTFHSIRPRYRQQSFPKLGEGLSAIQRPPLFEFARRGASFRIPKRETTPSRESAIRTFRSRASFETKKSARKNLRTLARPSDFTVHRSTDDKSSDGAFSLYGVSLTEDGFFLGCMTGRRKSVRFPAERSYYPDVLTT